MLIFVKNKKICDQILFSISPYELNVEYNIDLTSSSGTLQMYSFPQGMIEGQTVMEVPFTSGNNNELVGVSAYSGFWSSYFPFGVELAIECSGCCTIIEGFHPSAKRDHPDSMADVPNRNVRAGASPPRSVVRSGHRELPRYMRPPRLRR